MELFQGAALDDGWDAALAALAEATGARHGQLIGVGSNAAVPFNRITEFDPDVIAEWMALNGADPRLNARVRAGLSAPEMTPLTEADFASDSDLRGGMYDLYRRHGIHNSCQTTLLREGSFAAGLAILQGDREGSVEAETRRLFAAVAPHVRGAIRMNIALEGQGAALVANAFAAVSLAAFVCDSAGVVCAMTPAAEALAAGQRHLAVTRGRLRAVHPTDETRLNDAIFEAGSVTAGGWSSGSELQLRTPGGGAPLALQIAPLPARETALRFHATTLVVARRPSDLSERGPRLQSQYGLTAAETQVALALARGETLAQVSQTRQVSIGTLRSQLKSIFGKLGVRRQAELAAKLARDA